MTGSNGPTRDGPPEDVDEGAQAASPAGPPEGPASILIDQVRAAAPGLIASGRHKKGGDGQSDHTSATPASSTDLLASAIADLAAHHGKPIAVPTLVAGLALERGFLPREHVGDAARRAGLACEVVRKTVPALEDVELPVLVFTRDGGIEVLWRLIRNQRGKPETAVVSAPGLAQQAIEVPVSDVTKAATGEIVTFKPKSGLDERGETAVAAKRSNWFFCAFRDSRRIYAEAIAATLAVNLLALAMPLFSMNVYDRVLPNAAEATLWALAIGVMIAIAFDFLIRCLRAQFVDAASRKADVKLSAHIYARLLGARLSPLQSSTGVRANTLREFETLREFFNSATLTAFGDLPFMLLFLGVIWMVAGPLALVVAAAIPFILLAGFLTQRALHALILASFQETAQKTAVAVETLVGMETIKAAGAESWAARKWEAAVAEHVRTGLRIRHVSNLGQHFVHAMQTLVQVVVVIVGFYLVSAGQITMGALIAATILSGRALAPLAQAAMLLARFNQARIAYQTLNEIVAAPQERSPEGSYLSKTDFKGDINFEKTSYAYSEDAEPALSGFEAAISAGEHVAILGGIGSGKTTALKLLHGLYRPKSGRVLIDGVCVDQIEPALLRANSGLLLQGAELFHGTIRENITMGMPNVPDQAVLKSAHTAGALDWVVRLPHGFDTLIRERGAGLSGGQRQSVALARALLNEPRILLLDEPTSDMDGRTEQLVIERLRKEMTGRTLILVTHRPALLELVDRIIVLELGRKLEDGPKATVLKRLKDIARKRSMAAAKQPAGGTRHGPAPSDPSPENPPADENAQATATTAASAQDRRVKIKPGTIRVGRPKDAGTS